MSGSNQSCATAGTIENISCVTQGNGMGSCTWTRRGTCDQGDPDNVVTSVTQNCNSSFSSCTCSCEDTNDVCEPVTHSGACGR
jgi:hypothetical protein